MRGIYVHIPFCQHKCSYCDFYSVVQLQFTEQFVRALCQEMQLYAERMPELAEQPIATVFLGGGTPSLLPLPQLEAIVRQLRALFPIAEDAEWSIEANPGTVDLERLRAIRALGFRRISFGVQSFQEAELRFLERIHTPQEARAAVEWAHAAGFDSINVDLMFAIPGQTLRSWERTLQEALALAPHHISAYSLIWEPGTPLYARWQRGEVHPVAEELDTQMYALVAQFLEAAGYVHYEVSNFARPGHCCRHNLLYWHGQEYLAVGPSAHGFLRGRRYWNVRSLHGYVRRIAAGELPIAGMEQFERLGAAGGAALPAVALGWAALPGASPCLWAGPVRSGVRALPAVGARRVGAGVFAGADLAQLARLCHCR
jgi:oxygen-independent coproporphyrinogen-3 oxidase